MGDLVIVQPQAVAGIIQVKRTFTDSSVRKGVKNIVDAKRLLYSTLAAKVNEPNTPLVFSALVGFDDDVRDSGAARNRHAAAIRDAYRKLVADGIDKTIAVTLLPNFVGSIRQQYTFSPIEKRTEYYTLRSVVHGKNVVPQTLSMTLNGMIGRKDGIALADLPPVGFPAEPRGRQLFAFEIER